jgi:hypothetical protein
LELSLNIHLISLKPGRRNGSIKETSRTATELLKLQLYVTTVVHSLQLHDLVARLNFYNWNLESVHSDELDPKLTLFSDEPWFYLNTHVNTKSRYWSVGNPHLRNKVPLHDVQVGVWCTLSAKRIITSCVYAETVNSERYVMRVQQPFSGN